MDRTASKVPKKSNIFEHASLLSRLFFWWSLPIMRDGSKRELTNEDVCEPMEHQKSGYCAEIVTKAWEEELMKNKRSGAKPQLLNVIMRIYGPQFAALCVASTVQEIVSFAQVYFLFVLLQYYSLPRANRLIADALWPVAGIIACSCLRGYLQHFVALRTSLCGLSARLAVGPLLYRKVLRLSKSQKANLSSGFIINLFAIDSKKLENFFLMLFQLVLAPFSLVASSIVMWFVVGWPAVPGIVFAFICVPLQAWMSQRCSSARHAAIKKVDTRIYLMNEIIAGIQVLKMYAWEKPFSELIYSARKIELKSLREAMRWRTAGSIALVYRSRVGIFLVLLSYGLSRGSIDSLTVYVTMALFNINHISVSQMMMKGCIFAGEGLLSLKRMTEFLLVEDDGNETFGDVSDRPVVQEPSSLLENPAAVRIEGLAAAWSKDAVDPVLSDVNLDFPRGELTAVVGAVGSGKSALLHAIIGEMAVAKGAIFVSGRISYAAQEPWVFQGSVRDNIVFGEDFHPERYDKVVEVCQLDRDIAAFPYGDSTVVGERGVRVSGGQKARIGLARAVYRNADTYLLDDPLSAVDVNVGKLIFNDCIRGVLEGKTVILVTHQLQILESVTRIVWLENGMVKTVGSFNDLHGNFGDIPAGIDKAKEKLIFTSGNNGDVEKTDLEKMKLPVVLEHKMFESVGGTLWIYLKSGGSYWAIFLFFALFIFTHFSASSYDFWQNQWVEVEDSLHRTPLKANNVSEGLEIVSVSAVDSFTEYSLIVLGTILVVMVVSAISEVFYFARFCMQASWNIHDKMFKAVIRTSMEFFNSNTSGRILNRFSQELSSVDEVVTELFTDTLSVGLYLVGSIVMVAIVNPFITAIIAACILVIAVLKSFYICTSVQLKKLESAARSPVIAHVNQTLNGLTTIRGFSAQSFLTLEYHKHQDHLGGAQFLFIGISRTFGFWVEFIGAIYISIVVSSLLALDTGAASVGLALTQVLSTSSFLQFFVRMIVDLENALTSVERTTEYAGLPSEVNWEPESTPGNEVGSTWPQEGKITFKDVSFRHKKDGPNVLHNLNFTVTSGEKVGIVGRTGAGKSSLISSLFRMAEVSGCIEIDGIDTAAVSLHTLRSRISIIPQDPVLFSGTLRTNIDPFNEYPDDKLWIALEEVELKEVVGNLPKGLDSDISEGGGNLSVGQKQLVCLARAIVRNNKILVLDEATANVDHETDALIQKTIRRKFGDKTVLTVAHRLNTVMDSDKILVLSNGHLVEFDHPHVLLQNKDGHFAEMVSSCGHTLENAFRATAEKNFEQRNRDET